MPRHQWPPLNKRHQRPLASRLTVLDEAICDFERWAQGRGVESVLFAERNDLTEEQTQLLRGEIAEMREILSELRDALHLEPSVRQAKQDIASRCSLLWEMLIELQPKYLRRYGEWPAEVLELVSEKTAVLQACVEAVGKIARGADGL